MLEVDSPYFDKFHTIKNKTGFSNLESTDQDFIYSAAHAYQFSLQELREIVIACQNFSMWDESQQLKDWWQHQELLSRGNENQRKKALFQKLRVYIKHIQAAEKIYPHKTLPPPKRKSSALVASETDKKILGMCPVYSEDTVCCGLRTIDAVEGCGMGCSYCTIQTFYGNDIEFDTHFSSKLSALKLDPDRFYHIGTGQSSDSLMWGNKFGVLDALCTFAHQHPNILLELKTKSNNVRYFLEHDIPKNIVCSWSLNTKTIIENEEHNTASLEKRLQAAESIVATGRKVAFHFHPMVFYDGWKEEYKDLATMVMHRFDANDVLFTSFGTVTFIKPVLQEIRKRKIKTKILQMEMVADPKGKLTYPDDIKKALFTNIFGTFKPWHKRVFMYLCMEKAEFWESTFGFVYRNNNEFEFDFGKQTMNKL